jgi:glutamate-ammonia-ligase adenylyltransferase
VKSYLSSCPDPERAVNNIEAFLSQNPGYEGKLKHNLSRAAMLFSYSQFLANYSMQYPDALFHALNNLEESFEKSHLRNELRSILISCASIGEGMSAVRRFRKQKFLIITLKDILKLADLQSLMLDMSNLADVVLDESLLFVSPFIAQRYGSPGSNTLVVIGLGKLGAQELNYSSDVDIIFVYRDEGETAGMTTFPGATINKITALEYYSKLVEEYTRFLSANTGDGFAYRIDLRLRPQGRHGSLALSLRGHEEYYESWGQLWERAALLRARVVAGDSALGQEFLEMIRPFVYRKYLGFDAIDEIRRMKSQVEQIKSGPRPQKSHTTLTGRTLSMDIKRGYGGIREIEFFIQIFQLIYGGKEVLIRDRSTFRTLHHLLQKGLIGYEDFHHLFDNYIFLRTLEHRLQQMNDIQTHTVPAGEREIDILGKRMGFDNGTAFLEELTKRRHKVRSIYDSLLFVGNDTGSSDLGILSAEFWDMDMPDEQLLTEELSKKGVKDTKRAIHYLMKIRNTANFFQTIRGRRLLEDLLPRFIDGALQSTDPDLALLHLVDFTALMATKEAYLETIAQRMELISSLTFIFSHSEYLSKILMSNTVYLDTLAEGEVRKKRPTTLKKELTALAGLHGTYTAVRLFRRLEEVRLGILFLDRQIEILELMKSLSKVAETIVALLVMDSAPSISVVSFGKLGGREITFNSDLDIIFLTRNEPSVDDVKAAEHVLKIAMSYTKDGMAYKMDTRLRPEGSKGPLVTSLEGLAAYYSHHARSWELQALLKARPITGDNYMNRSFMSIKRKVLLARGRGITVSEIKKMCERIGKELSRESLAAGAYDIKLGTGGLGELEFIVQYLQMKHCGSHPELLVQNTIDAIRRINKAGILNDCDTSMLSETYVFYRKIETMLRLRNEVTLKRDGAVLQGLADIVAISSEEILDTLDRKKALVSSIWDRLP